MRAFLIKAKSVCPEQWRGRSATAPDSARSTPRERHMAPRDILPPFKKERKGRNKAAQHGKNNTGRRILLEL